MKSPGWRAERRSIWGRATEALLRNALAAEALATGPTTDSSARSGTSLDDIYWVKSISKIIPICQTWMREQLAK
jgi:hypothetical protein